MHWEVRRGATDGAVASMLWSEVGVLVRMTRRRMREEAVSGKGVCGFASARASCLHCTRIQFNLPCSPETTHSTERVGSYRLLYM